MRIVGLFEWNSVEGRGGSPPREGGCPYPFDSPTDSVAIHRGHGAMFSWASARRGPCFCWAMLDGWHGGHGLDQTMSFGRQQPA